MASEIRVIRRAYSTLVIYSGAPAAVYKLNSRDGTRIEQAAGTSLDFLSQLGLQTALDQLGIQVQPLDDQDRAELAGVGLVSPTAAPPTPTASAAPSSAPRPAHPAPAAAPSAAPAATPRPARPAAPAQADADRPGQASKGSSRGGLIAAVVGLAAVALLALWLLNRLFAQPDARPAATPTAEATLRSQRQCRPTPKALQPPRSATCRCVLAPATSTR